MRRGKDDFGKAGRAISHAVRTHTNSGRILGRIPARAGERVARGIGRIWVAEVHGDTIESANGEKHSEQNDERQDFSLAY